ncbi:hypothetical protein [Mesorhizobium sp. WSM4310]|uniref:hypothetical protein n=1 Tax=Mesorhizobium sp. WSM4310 TaxID=2589883 RepID=UPI00163D5A54|nr:hypothetical protein [Mesorhizobium sp. WSM4310]
MPKTPTKPQIEKFRDLARKIETVDSEEPLNAALRKVAKSSHGLKVCPECQHVFQGNGWDGIDAHWKAKHESVMPYAEAWPLIKAGKYLKA